MKIGPIIECQACGASSVTKHKDKSILECQYCGAMMTYSEDVNKSSTVQTQHKPAKLGFLLVMIPVLVIILMIIFWYAFQNIRKNRSMASYEAEIISLAENSIPETLSQTERTVDIPLPESADSLSQLLSIESQVSGETSQGGKYWIIAVKNNSDQNMARPGVMLSAFNQTGNRLVEQGGWSMREILAAGEQTAILLFLNDVPADYFKEQITTFASPVTRHGFNQVDVKVKDYTVIAKNKQFELIGDVINQLDKPVKYVRIMAVAYNGAGEPVGLGNSFSTVKNLSPNQGSGFKVRVGTFLTEEPDSWQVWALARQ